MAYQLLHLVKVIADIAVALEFTDVMLLNPDFAIEMQESIAGTLQSLVEVDREEIASVFEEISTLYHDEATQYVKSLLVSYGIK